MHLLSRCDTLEKLKLKLPTLENELRDNIRFKEFYHFTFAYARNLGQKGLDLEMAIAYWNICLQGRFRLLPLWCKFLTVSRVVILSYLHLVRVDAWLG